MTLTRHKMFDINQCSDFAVPRSVMEAVVKVESGGNQFAIGVVKDSLIRQPKSLVEAINTVKMLNDRKYNFSVGIAQVNLKNLDRFNLNNIDMFDGCKNLNVGSKILLECYYRFGKNWAKAFSCYYSGNSTTGFRDGYVQKVFKYIDIDVYTDERLAMKNQ